MARRMAFLSAILWMGGMALASTALAQTKSAKPAPKTETGYVVSIGDTAMVVSNIAPGSGPAPAGDRQMFTRTVTQGPGPGGGQSGGVEIELRPGDVVRGEDGKRTLSAEAKKRFTPEQQKMIERDLNNGGPGGGAWQGGGPGGAMQFQLGPGDVVRGEDGKMTLTPEAKKRFTPEQQQRIQEGLNNSSQSGHGPIIVRKGPGGGPGEAQAQPGKAAAPSAPLQLTDFVLDKKTKSPKGLAKGDKVKVTYVEADGKKVATKIEKSA